MNRTYTILVDLEDGTRIRIKDSKGQDQKYAIAQLDNETSKITEEQFIEKLNTKFDKKIIDIKLLNGSGRKTPFVFSDKFIEDLSNYAIINNSTTVVSEKNVKNFQMGNFIGLLLANMRDIRNVKSFINDLCYKTEKDELYKIGQLLYAYNRDMSDENIKKSSGNDVAKTEEMLKNYLTKYADIRAIYLWLRQLDPKIKDNESILTPQEKLNEVALMYAEKIGLKTKKEEAKKEKEDLKILKEEYEKIKEEKEKKEQEKKRLSEWNEGYSIPDEEVKIEKDEKGR